MTATRLLAAALALGSVLGISCYSEPLRPSTYRYACEGDSDCPTDQTCRQGRCERPCTQRTAAEDCPTDDGYVTCFNGACASTCEVGANRCAPGQECIDIGLDIGGGGGGLFGGGSSDATIGICGIECGEGADICPEGEVCVPEFGACAVDCSQGQECPAGFACFFGLCAPETGFPTGEESGGEGSGGSDGSTGMGADPADDEERR